MTFKAQVEPVVSPAKKPKVQSVSDSIIQEVRGQSLEADSVFLLEARLLLAASETRTLGGVWAVRCRLIGSHHILGENGMARGEVCTQGTHSALYPYSLAGQVGDPTLTVPSCPCSMLTCGRSTANSPPLPASTSNSLQRHSGGWRRRRYDGGLAGGTGGGTHSQM